MDRGRGRRPQIGTDLDEVGEDGDQKGDDQRRRDGEGYKWDCRGPRVE